MFYHFISPSIPGSVSHILCCIVALLRSVISFPPHRCKRQQQLLQPRADAGDPGIWIMSVLVDDEMHLRTQAGGGGNSDEEASGWACWKWEAGVGSGNREAGSKGKQNKRASKEREALSEERRVLAGPGDLRQTSDRPKLQEAVCHGCEKHVDNSSAPWISADDFDFES